MEPTRRDQKWARAELLTQIAALDALGDDDERGPGSRERRALALAEAPSLFRTGQAVAGRVAHNEIATGQVLREPCENPACKSLIKKVIALLEQDAPTPWWEWGVTGSVGPTGPTGGRVTGATAKRWP